MKTKKCSACLNEYELSRHFFHRDITKTDWFSRRCKDCVTNKRKSAKIILSKEHWKRQCPVCKEVLSLSSKYFFRDKTKFMWFSNLCKICESKKKKDNEANRTRGNQYGMLNSKKDIWIKWFVYILESNWFYKIWLTSDKFTLKQRILKLQCGNPYEIKIVHLIRTADITYTEKRLHEKYKEKNIRWERYSLNDDDIKYLMSFDVIKANMKI